jgi:hypothetical protein
LGGRSRGARAALEAEGGTPRITDGEAELLAHFYRCVREYGWTDKPVWVERVEGFEGAEHVTAESAETWSGS